MSLRRKSKSSDFLSKPSSPRKFSFPIGRDLSKSRSGPSGTIYKSVVTGGDDLNGSLVKRSPTKKSPTKRDSLFPNTARFNGNASVLEEKVIIKDSGDEGEPSGETAQAKAPVEDLLATPSRSSRSPPSASPGGSVNLSKWGLPDKVVSAYQRVGVINMFPWQAECLNRGKVLDGGNLVYSAPTSAGKTLVAEILLLKRVVETKKKGLFILPFVALAREKMANLQRIFKGTGVRIDGYMGHLHPAGGLALLDIAVCTIEKANSLINKMVSEKKLHQLGVIVVDELHMVGDSGRGYLIELLLSKVRFLNQVRAESEENEEAKLKNSIQIIGMSATLPNLDMIAKWLDADLYTTDYRPVPLQENVKLGLEIFDKKWQKVRDVAVIPSLQNDPDHIVSLCYETARAGHGVLVFCPFKNWCESLSELIAKEFHAINATSPCAFLNREKSGEVVAQLRQSPAGLDQVLGRTVPLAVAFHHAGLTMDEREIIETAFRKGYVKVLIATTTLSSGVNLPARRVIIRSPLQIHNAVMDILTYYQMAGRAGRKGVDSEGESILMCKDSEKSKVTALFATSMGPVSSCLIPYSNGKLGTTMLRAALEIIANGAAKSVKEVTGYLDCTLFSAAMPTGSSVALARTIVDSLQEKELILIAKDNQSLHPSQLGNAVVWSGLSPNEGFTIFQELERARSQFNLETELHILYLITPLHVVDYVSGLDWYHYMLLWERLPAPWKRVGNLVGVDEQNLAAGVRGRLGNQSDPKTAKLLACMRRFYCALILNELVHEISLTVVATKYKVNKGMLQSLQQGASTYSGMITIFCQELGWINMGLLIEQFQSRLMFGVQRELLELIRIQFLSAQQARLLYQSGYPNLAKLATAEKDAIKEVLINSSPFTSKSNNESENGISVQQTGKKVLLNGLEAISEEEAAGIIIAEARRLLDSDMEALGFRLVETKMTDDLPQKPIDQMENERIATIRDDHKSRNVAEFSEIQSTQMDIDEPLDDALQAAEDIRRSQITKDEQNRRSFNQNPSEPPTPSKSQTDLILHSPDRVDSSDTEEEFSTRSDVPTVSTFQDYVFSSYSSVEEYFATPLPLLQKVREVHLPSVLKPHLAEFSTNDESLLVETESRRGREKDKNCSLRTPLFQQQQTPKSEGVTPVLFTTPGLHGKRKVTLDSAEDRPTKRVADDTICFDMDTRIDFEEEFLVPETSDVTSSPAKPSAIYEEELRIVIVTESQEVFSKFLEDWRKQTSFCLSVACEKMAAETTIRIGPPRLNGQKKIFHGIPLPSENLTVVGIAVSWSGKTAHYISLSDRPKSSVDLDALPDATLTTDIRIAAVRSVFAELSNQSVIMYDLKRQLYLLSVSLGLPISAAKFCDPKVAGWLLDMGSDERTLQMLVAERCPGLLSLLEDMKSYRGHGNLGAAVSCPVTARIRSSIDAVVSRVLFAKLLVELKSRDLRDLFESVEMPTICCLVGMELNGFGFSLNESRSLRNAIHTQLDLIERRAFEVARKKFQLTAPDAVGQVLFVDLRIPPPSEAIQHRQTRGKTKIYYSTSKEILTKIQKLHPLPLLILEHRRLQHALTKFVYPIEKVVTTSKVLQMERIHGTCFTYSSTGRISMAEPSLQNIPKDFAIDAWLELSQSQGRNSKLKKVSQDKMKISLRSSFLPFNGGVLLSADYSQLELRIIAHLAGDDKLGHALSGAGDVFKMIASQWKKIEASKVSEEERQQAKKICYGIIYGMGAKALAEQLEVTDQKAEIFMQSFKSAYPAIDRFVEDTVAQCRRTGYVETISGCRRYLSNISSMKMDLRTQAERQAVNTTVQGSAANLAKAALVRIDAELRKTFPNSIPHQLKSSSKEQKILGAYLVLQLHDEFIFEVNAADLEVVAEIVERHMRTAMQLHVPLRVNMRVGPNWGALGAYQLPRPTAKSV